MLKSKLRRVRAGFGSVKELIGTIVLLAMISVAIVLLYFMTQPR